ncbi:hypothetical protein CCAJJPOJ_03492 [Lelliottia sp. T2.26D-8]|nr:hypothetical protein CCAJJPOJ_03492 [Lelliottia sp. T2.26D-8]
MISSVVPGQYQFTKSYLIQIFFDLLHPYPFSPQRLR